MNPTLTALLVVGSIYRLSDFRYGRLNVISNPNYTKLNSLHTSIRNSSHEKHGRLQAGTKTLPPAAAGFGVAYQSAEAIAFRRFVVPYGPETMRSSRCSPPGSHEHHEHCQNHLLCFPVSSVFVAGALIFSVHVAAAVVLP